MVDRKEVKDMAKTVQLVSADNLCVKGEKEEEIMRNAQSTCCKTFPV
jgi:hypothetical protein